MTEKWKQFPNIGWSLGSECPYNCRMCYSASQRGSGRSIERPMADRIMSQLDSISVCTVNFGGNEPIFTHGNDPRRSILPYVVRSLADRGIAVGMTSAGRSVNYMYSHHFGTLALLNDVDISLDSPFEAEHNENRGAQLFGQAMLALKRCREMGISNTIVMCGMNWNLTPKHLDALVGLAKRCESNVRINFMRPTDDQCLGMFPSSQQYYEAIAHLASNCKLLCLGEPTAGVLKEAGAGCPCGVSSLRINAITHDGKIPVSPCVYMHDFRTGDLLTEHIMDVVEQPLFQLFRSRHFEPSKIAECSDCAMMERCRGGCAARAYYQAGSGERQLFRRDCYCPVASDVGLVALAKGQLAEKEISAVNLVHQNYLCTLIFQPI